MVRWIVIGIAGLALCGCFALDEIDSGQEIMDQHYGHHAEGEDPGQAEPAKEPPGFLDRARAWVASLGKGDDKRAAPRDDGPPPDPENVLVRCQLDGSLQFTRKFDCQLKGGKVLGPLHSAAR